MGYLTWWSLPKRAWFIILVELGVILSLSVSLYMTYINDAYFQSYANSLSPILVPALSVAFAISSASVAAYLYIGIKRIQTERDTEVTSKKKEHHSAKESTEPHRNKAPTKSENQPQQPRGRLKPIVSSNSDIRLRQHSREPENHDSLPESKKQP